MSQPVHILGPGALGCLWAARLAPHLPVILIGRASSTGSKSFTLVDPNPGREPDRLHLTLPYFDRAPLSGGACGAPLREILVFTKSHATLAALEALRSWMDPLASIVLFQNGLGSQMAVLKAFAGHPVLAAVTTEGANRPDADTVVHAGAGITRLGILQAPPSLVDSSLLEACAELLGRSGLSIAVTTDIHAFLWEKLAINCAINPFTALYDCANGDVPAHPGFRQLWPVLRIELTDMLACAGYPMPLARFEERVFDVMTRTHANISSMLQDVRAGRLTEIDDINGFAWRYLQEQGLPHAVNLELWNQVRALTLRGMPTELAQQND